MPTTINNPALPYARELGALEARGHIPFLYNPTTEQFELIQSQGNGLLATATYVWNTSTLAWDKAVQAGGGGGGGGGAVTVADGADVTQGAIGDAAVITDTTGTLSGKLRGLVKWAYERMPTSLGQKTMAASLPVVVASDQSNIGVQAWWYNGIDWDRMRGTITNGLRVDVTRIQGSVALDAATLTALENVSIDNFPATQNIAGTVSIAGAVAVTGPLTDAQLRASPVPTVENVSDLAANAPVSVSVGVVSAAAVAANAARKGLIIINLSSNNVSFGLDGAAATLNAGITLTPFGVWVMDKYTFTAGAVAAIASAAASVISIQEFQ